MCCFLVQKEFQYFLHFVAHILALIPKVITQHSWKSSNKASSIQGKHHPVVFLWMLKDEHEQNTSKLIAKCVMCVRVYACVCASTLLSKVYTASSSSVPIPLCHSLPLGAGISGSRTTFCWLQDVLFTHVQGGIVILSFRSIIGPPFNHVLVKSQIK